MVRGRLLAGITCVRAMSCVRVKIIRSGISISMASARLTGIEAGVPSVPILLTRPTRTIEKARIRARIWPSTISVRSSKPRIWWYVPTAAWIKVLKAVTTRWKPSISSCTRGVWSATATTLLCIRKFAQSRIIQTISLIQFRLRRITENVEGLLYSDELCLC